MMSTEQRTAFLVGANLCGALAKLLSGTRVVAYTDTYCRPGEPIEFARILEPATVQGLMISTELGDVQVPLRDHVTVTPGDELRVSYDWLQLLGARHAT